MFNFLKENSQTSTTRVVLFIVSLCIVLLSAAVSFNIAYVSMTTNEINWFGLSTFITSMSSLIGVVMYGKVKQKAFEVDTTSTTNINTTNTNTTTSNIEEQ